MNALTELAGPLQALHLLRPTLLLALLAIVPAAALWHWRRRDTNVWRQSVDAHLLSTLLVAGGRRGWLGFVLAALTYTLAVVAMSGPSWRQTERPVYQTSMPLVVVLDLSSSANATDLPPSRLLQARAKLATLLRKRAGGEVALLVYAGESFTVAPLTEDSANVALFLDALSPSVMPVDGKRADRGIDAAAQLLQQAGFKQGEILLVSDGADRSAESAARTARSRGFTVSALGMGSERGAAYRMASGEIAQAKLDEGSLRDLAGQGGGRYARIAPDDADLRALGVLDPSQQPLADETAESDGGKTWLDEGYWLVLPVMLLALLAFRRRAVVAVLAMVCVLPFAQPARAADGTLWQRADQLQQQRLDAGVQAYRKGDFAAAQKAFEAVPTDEGCTTWATRWRDKANMTRRSTPMTVRSSNIRISRMPSPIARRSMRRVSVSSRKTRTAKARPRIRSNLFRMEGAAAVGSASAQPASRPGWAQPAGRQEPAL